MIVFFIEIVLTSQFFVVLERARGDVSADAVGAAAAGATARLDDDAALPQTGSDLLAHRRAGRRRPGTGLDAPLHHAAAAATARTRRVLPSFRSWPRFTLFFFLEFHSESLSI